MKRVVITGAAGVGKTTLLDSIFKGESPLEFGFSFENFVKIPEIAQELCKERGYKSIYEIGDHHQFRLDVLDEQIRREEEIIQSGKSFISDRSTIDCWVYFMRWSWNTGTVEEAEEYYQKARSQAEKYDQIIYIPKTRKTPEGGFRWSNDTYQTQVDRLIHSVLFEWDLLDRVQTFSPSSLPSLSTSDSLSGSENLI